MTKLFPIFAVRDMEEALGYYCDSLGFQLAWQWGEPVLRAGVNRDEIEIQLECGGLGAPAGPSVAYCHMIDVDSYYRECQAQGALIAMEIGDRPWGMRDFRVVDPSGNRIGFAAELT